MPKVMIVDDDRNTVKLLQTLLELDGFVVVVAGRGADVLPVAEQAKPEKVRAEFLPRGERFGHDRAHRDDRRLGVGAGFAKPITAGERTALAVQVGASAVAFDSLAFLAN